MHTYHPALKIPENIDVAIFSGDCSNPRDPYSNEQEVLNFIEWYGMIKTIPFKLMTAGNHDVSIERKFVTREKIESKGLIYLENESVELEINDGISEERRKLKIYGSPMSPSFGEGWAYNRKRNKLNDLWQTIPTDSDIVVTHTPPKGALDLSFDRAGKLEFCGCNALAKRLRVINPILSLFGHIHSMKGIDNAGYVKFVTHDTIYSNGSVVMDGNFGGKITNGNIFEI